MASPIYFSASQVAGLIGRHKYQTQSYALLSAANARQNSASQALCTHVGSYNDAVRDALMKMKRERSVFDEMKDVQAAAFLAASQKTQVDKATIDTLVESASKKANELDSRIRESELKREEETLKSEEILSKKDRDSHIEAILETSKSLALAYSAASAADPLRTKSKIEPKKFNEMAAAVVNASTRNIHTAGSQNLIEEAEAMEPSIKLVASVAKDKSVENHFKLSEECKRSAALEYEKIADFQGRKRVIQQVANSEDMKALLQEAVQKKRGRDEEEEVINDAETRMNIKISERNTKSGKLWGRNYVVLGRVDGVSEEDIVEVKTRRNWFSAPPQYDIVQLRVYLRMFDKPRGILIEENRDRGLTRETVIQNCDDEWSDIDRSLEECAQKLLACSETDIIAWSRDVNSS
jgi:hypothetical protein